MTIKVLSTFGIEISKNESGFYVKGNQKFNSPRDYIAEGDWSNGAFWLSADAICGSITVTGLDHGSLQKDKEIADILNKIGKNTLTATSVVGNDIPDILPIIATVLSLAKGKSVITGGERLRIKESDRIATTTAMLKSLGAIIEATEDGFVINGVDNFIGGEVDAANDHRIAMCAAIASGRCTGDIIIRGAECVNKSYPTFFEDFEKLGGKYRVIDGQQN